MVTKSWYDIVEGNTEMMVYETTHNMGGRRAVRLICILMYCWFIAESTARGVWRAGQAERENAILSCV